MKIPVQTDDQKREELAKLINVDPARLVSMSGRSCKRITNAFKHFGMTKETLCYRNLMRTPNIGRRSADELCDALNLSKSLHAPAVGETEVAEPFNHESATVSTLIAELLTANPETKSKLEVISAPGSTCFVVEKDGKRFRVRTERMY